MPVPPPNEANSEKCFVIIDLASGVKECGFDPTISGPLKEHG